MFCYLDCKTIKDSIEAARSAKDTINYWKAVLSLYFPATEGFSLIHPFAREDMLVLRFPHIPQRPDPLQHDIQCIVVVSAVEKDQPACEDQESDAYAYLMDLDSKPHGREAFGIQASGSRFSLFKVAGNKHYNLIPTSALEDLTTGRILEENLCEIYVAAYERQCKVLVQSDNDMYTTAPSLDLVEAFPARRCSISAPITSAMKAPTLNNSFLEALHEALARVGINDEPIQGSFKCWWRILLWIEMENSGVSREYMASAGIISLNHILNLSEAQLPEATKTSRCLLMVKLNEQPQWKVSESNVYALLRKAATGSLDGFTHGILAYERQFLLFQVHRSGEIHYLMGSDGVPQDLRQLLNDAKIREEFEGYMNDIVVSAQHHRVSSRVQDTSTPIIASRLSDKDSDTIQREDESDSAVNSNVSNSAGPMVGKAH